MLSCLVMLGGQRDQSECDQSFRQSTDPALGLKELTIGPTNSRGVKYTVPEGVKYTVSEGVKYTGTSLAGAVATLVPCKQVWPPPPKRRK